MEKFGIKAASLSEVSDKRTLAKLVFQKKLEISKFFMEPSAGKCYKRVTNTKIFKQINAMNETST